MNRFIIDSSTALKWVFDDEENVDAARKLLSDYLDGKIVLIAPDLWLIEVANAIKSAIISGRVNEKKGSQLLDLLLEAKPKIVPMEGYIKSSYKMAVKHKISVYDSLYVTIALENDTPFITADKKLYEALKGVGGEIMLLSDIREM